MPSAGYEFLPHTTDAYIQTTGSTFEEALEYAGIALFDTMCEVEAISPDEVDNVQVTGADEVALLYNWLEALLLKFELERKVYSRFKVILTKTPSNEFKINAKIFGKKWTKEKQGAKVEVKAVTYHKMEISHNVDGTTLRFILDL